MKYFFIVQLLLITSTFTFGALQTNWIGSSLYKNVPENRIIGGESIPGDNVAPYIVSLSVSNVIYTHACAGVIIDREWVLTAAHCVHELESFAGSAIGLPVYAGMVDRTQYADAQVRHIDFAFKHKQFDGQIGSEDIALLHVKPSFVFNSRVFQLWLPLRNSDYTGQTASTVGWGLSDAASNAFATRLERANGTVMSWQQCVAALPEDAAIQVNNICTSIVACHGDGGSPLVTQGNENMNLELIGFASWGFLPCGYNNRPTIYTAVTPYLNWIAEVQWAYNILN